MVLALNIKKLGILISEVFFRKRLRVKKTSKDFIDRIAETHERAGNGSGLNCIKPGNNSLSDYYSLVGGFAKYRLSLLCPGLHCKTTQEASV